MSGAAPRGLAWPGLVRRESSCLSCFSPVKMKIILLFDLKFSAIFLSSQVY